MKYTKEKIQELRARWSKAGATGYMSDKMLIEADKAVKAAEKEVAKFIFHKGNVDLPRTRIPEGEYTIGVDPYEGGGKDLGVTTKVLSTGEIITRFNECYKEEMGKITEICQKGTL